MPHSESRKTSGCDAVVFRKRPLDAVCLTVWNGAHASLEKQKANSGEVSSQQLVGFFKDECTNLLWRRAKRWLDWMGRDEPERQRLNLSGSWQQGRSATYNTLSPHVPYWWVNNPTLGEFCFTMIGRADIEGSKSNFAMNAWLPQASYPCGNFSDTSSFEFRRSKGSLGHAFTSTGQKSHCVSIRWDHRNALFSLNSRIPLVRTSSELAVQRAGSISSSPPTAYVFGIGTPVPSPQSQSFSRSYGSILPTSLAYIVPSTRGCSPWRPDAVMSTTGCGRHSVLRIFKGRRERTGHHATCGALPAAGPYLRLSRLYGGQAVKQKRQLFPRLPPTSPDFLTLPSTATSRFKNFNPILFWSTREMRCLSGFPDP
ncbi:hypothetical protein CQW23_33884 [Capsicum baccatum]|uniref:Protein TAR1 n=1 Tax=Capsicum baccatum TaxID=33114 RepID=A0A2G2V0F4_CAPBA|nr:hypothetical protein CQW23_33884 [Capsicum baccatum]